MFLFFTEACKNKQFLGILWMMQEKSEALQEISVLSFLSFKHLTWN